MNTFAKTLLASSALLAASSQAANITVYDDAVAGAASFQSLLRNVVAVEDFNGLGTAPVTGLGQHDSWENKANSFDTAVGRFTLNVAGQSDAGNVEINDLMIESTRTGEFGRQTLPKQNGDFWLDSNDAEKVTWLFNQPPGGSFTAVGFELADASDVSADLTLLYSDGTSETISFPEPNGNIKYVTITSEVNILGGSLVFQNSTDNDGWGIDNVTLGNVPEPGTLLLMGLGLLGLGAARRRAGK